MREDSERCGIFVVQYVQGGGKSRWLGQSSKKEEYGRYGKLQGEYATASVHSSRRGKEPLTVERVLETSTREQEEEVERSEIGEPPNLSRRRVRKYGLPSSATMGSHCLRN